MEFFKDIVTTKNGSYATSSSDLFCENVIYNKIFKFESSQTLILHIKSINAALTGKEVAHTGLAHLLLLLPQCPHDLLIAHGEQWVRLCLSVLKFQDVELYASVLAVISYIFRCCYSNPDLRKSISKLDPKFVLSLSSVKFLHFSEVCDCLYDYMKLFPLQILPHKNSIYSILMQLLNSPSKFSIDEVVKGGRVFAALPLPGGSDVNINSKGSQLDQLISLCHSTLDVIFSNVEENEEYKFCRDHNLPVTSLSSTVEMNEPVLSLLTAIPVLFNGLIFIEEFLSHASSQFILVKPKELVLVAFRILQVESNMLRKSHSIESTALSFVLPSLHVKALKYLKCLINSRLCYLFLNLIEDQLVGMLKISTVNRGSDVTSVKVLCYQCLRDVVKVSNGCHAQSVEDLLPSLISEITPVKQHLIMRKAIRTDRVSQMNIGKKSKKKGYTIKQSHSNDLPEALRIQEIHQSIPSVLSALNYVEFLFLYAHHSVDVKCVRVIYNHLITLVSMPRSGFLHLVSLRNALFRTLEAYALYPHPLCPPNYSDLFKAFRSGARDPNQEISSTCNRALSTLSFVTSNPSILDLSDVVRLNVEKNKESWLKERDIQDKISNGGERNSRSLCFAEDDQYSPRNDFPQSNGDGKNHVQNHSKVDDGSLKRDQLDDIAKASMDVDSISSEESNDECNEGLSKEDRYKDESISYTSFCSSSHNHPTHINHDDSSSAMESRSDSDTTDDNKDARTEIPESRRGFSKDFSEEGNGFLEGNGSNDQMLKRKVSSQNKISSAHTKKLRGQKNGRWTDNEGISVEAMLESFVDAEPDLD